MLKHPLFTKLVALAAITVLLLIGLGMIEDVVRDRLRYRSLTAQSVADSLAGPQTLMGPMIHSACVESWDVETGKGDERRMVEQRREFLLTATLNLELVGTERISIVPLGGNTEVLMTSSWPHPSFAGRFLPSEREVKPDGFSAQWRLSSLATTAQADIAGGSRICVGGYDENAHEYTPGGTTPRDCADSFSVAFVDPVNPYTLSDRATKYGVLFIALTFVAVGLFELMKKLRVHPVQYLLVGSALCSFFLLLVSLSEHLPFGASYAAAATACVLLLGYYASHMLGSLARGIPLGAGVALLYGLLYVLLQLEQTALAVGAIALFLVLTAVMVLTRKVNWYGLTQGMAPQTPRTPKATGFPLPAVPGHTPNATTNIPTKESP